jgi:hypothetical protein
MAVSRIFHDKKEEFIQDIIHRQVFGKTAYVLYSVEYQKRGMPHIHCLIRLATQEEDLKRGVDVDSPDTLEQIISAEIPKLPKDWEKTDEGRQQKRLRDTITKLNMHDCDQRCKVRGRCSKYFPKDYCECFWTPHSRILDNGSASL